MTGDADPVPHPVAVTLPRRSDLVIHAPKRVVSGRVTADAIAASLSPRAAAAALPEMVGKRPAAPPQPGPATGPPRPSFAHDPALNPFVARVAEYVRNYGAELSSVDRGDLRPGGDRDPAPRFGRPSPSTAAPRAGGRRQQDHADARLRLPPGEDSRVPGLAAVPGRLRGGRTAGPRPPGSTGEAVRPVRRPRALESAQAIVRESARYNSATGGASRTSPRCRSGSSNRSTPAASTSGRPAKRRFRAGASSSSSLHGDHPPDVHQDAGRRRHRLLGQDLGGADDGARPSDAADGVDRQHHGELRVAARGAGALAAGDDGGGVRARRHAHQG